MPRKIGELIAELRKAGFDERSGKGSHRRFYHPKFKGAVTISGKLGAVAHPYQEADGCYVGRVPGLILGGCHGDDEKAVYAELCDIVDEVIEDYRADGRPLPPATVGRIRDADFREESSTSLAAE